MTWDTPAATAAAAAIICQTFVTLKHGDQH